MQPFDEIIEYSKTVCEQIRWKRAHQVISEEIENHINDQRDAFISQGEDEESATKKAILEMGDAVSIGVELDKTHKPKPQWIMIALTAVLMMIGMLSNYFIGSSQYSLGRFSFTPYIISIAVFLICYFADFSILGKYAKYIYFIVLAASIIGLLFSSQINGDTWLVFNKFSISLPNLSLIFPVTYSIRVYAVRHKGYMGVILCGVGYIPFAAILLLIPSFTGFVLLTISVLVILYMAITKGWFGIDRKRGLLLVLIPIMIAIVFSILYALQSPYSLSRFSIAINPYSEPLSSGYMHCLIRDFLANSKFIGEGSIPAPYNGNTPLLPAFGSCILAILTHKFGWIVFIGILGVITAFSVLGLYYTTKQKSVLGTLISLPIVITFIYQVVIYIINNLGYGILTPLSLPLVSYGNALLIINSALIGFMLSVFRSGDAIKDRTKPYTKGHPIFSYQDGKLTINIKGIN